MRCGCAERGGNLFDLHGILEHAEAAPAEVPFAVGARVVSERWGQGTVQRYDGDQITVLFDEHGYRELFVPVVLERGLLRPVSS